MSIGVQTQYLDQIADPEITLLLSGGCGGC